MYKYVLAAVASKSLLCVTHFPVSRARSQVDSLDSPSRGNTNTKRLLLYVSSCIPSSLITNKSTCFFISFHSFPFEFYIFLLRVFFFFVFYFIYLVFFFYCGLLTLSVISMEQRRDKKVVFYFILFVDCDKLVMRFMVILVYCLW